MLLDGVGCLDEKGTWNRRLPDGWWRPAFEALDEELRRRGWPAGDDCYREDLSVYLDESRRIQVRLLPG
jgi:hypothetical protein